MNRRAFIAALGGAAAWPLVARAQQRERMRRIGVLQPGSESDPELQNCRVAFVDGLQKFGWTEGTNVLIDYRWVGDDADRIRLYATELTGMRPDVIWASGSLPLLFLKRATRTIPVVFTQVYDPVGSGFVTNLTRPGGNITGFTLGEFSMGGKTLEVLKEVAPRFLLVFLTPVVLNGPVIEALIPIFTSSALLAVANAATAANTATNFHIATVRIVSSTAAIDRRYLCPKLSQHAVYHVLGNHRLAIVRRASRPRSCAIRAQSAPHFPRDIDHAFDLAPFIVDRELCPEHVS